MKPHPLFRLLAENRNRRPRGEAAPVIVTDDKTGDATVYLYQPIIGDPMEAEYWGGISAATLVPQLAAIKADNIRVRMDCPGGDVFAATAIAQAFREHPANVACSIDGLAASAATTIAIACNSVQIAPGAFFMVHRSWTFAWGNANDLIETAALLEKVDGSIAGQYASKTTKSAAEMLALMDAETWMDAEAAVAAGFCDAVAEGAKANALAWNLSAYERAPKAAPAPAESSTPKPNEITDAEADRRAFLARRTRVLTACAQ